MATKNRAARMSDLRNGVTVYFTNYGTSVSPLTIMNRPYKQLLAASWESWAVDVQGISSYSGKTSNERLFLADRGFAGHSHDDRPPMIYMSRGAAERAMPRTREWYAMLQKRSAEDQSPDWDAGADYYYEDSPDVESIILALHQKFEKRGVTQLYAHEHTTKYAWQQEDFRVRVGDEYYYGKRFDILIRVDTVVDIQGTQLIREVDGFYRRVGNCWVDVGRDHDLFHTVIPWEKRKVLHSLPVDKVWSPILNGKLEFMNDDASN